MLQTSRNRRDVGPVPAFAASDALVRVQELAGILRCGVSTVWRDVANSTLPKPVYLSPRNPRWKMADIRAHIARIEAGR